MTDLHFSKESYTCIVMQDVYERLDRDTALRYRSKLDLQRGLGQDVDDDLESLSEFLRREAETLELAGESISKLNINSIDLENSPAEANDNCDLGCKISHVLVRCDVFLKMSVEERRDYTKTTNRCYRCLQRFHLVRNCLMKEKCTYCNGLRHHKLLCMRKVDEETPASNALNNAGVETNDEVKPGDYSPLVVVEVKAADGQWKKAKCFLDGGSNSSLIRNKFAKSSQLHGSGTCDIKLGVAGGGVHREERSEVFDLEIRPIGGEVSYLVNVCGVRKPCFDIKPIPSEIFEKYPHLRAVKEKVYIRGGEVDLLIGRDYAPLIVDESTLRATSNPDDSPSVTFTRLGCYLYGSLSYPQPTKLNNIIRVNHISKWEEDEAKLFFYGDILGVQPTSLCVCSDTEILESNFIKHVRSTTRIDENGRVCVQMPWKPGYPEKLPNNFIKARDQMFRRERQLLRDNKLEEYNEEVKNLVERGVVKCLSLAESKNAGTELGWYLNHRIIERPDKETSKLRIVFDSAAPYQGVCLNDALEKGPSYTNLLFRCLLKWRVDYVAVTGDIGKMFNQVSMYEGDQRFHRFLWRNGVESEAIIIYQWLRVLFGDKPSPDLATFALRFLADEKQSVCPLGSSILKDKTYVDDVSFSESDSDRAKLGISEVNTVLDSGHFRIKVWNSNDPEVDENSSNPNVDVLGHKWDKVNDVFSLKMSETDISGRSEFTKRTLLGDIAKIWDPFGYLLPVTIKYRIKLQQVWQLGYKWDEPIISEIAETWREYLKEMSQLNTLRLKRCLKPEGIIGKPQLHAFSDGGNDAYGTCVFIRWPTSGGVKISFVAAKAFVAPLKKKTIPRLELMGAVAMSRVTKEITESLGLEFEYKRFWIDSEIVIYWLLSESNRYKPFVSTRVQEFQDTHPNWKREIRYVRSEENSADCLTKSISLEYLSRWHGGHFSTFLNSDEGFSSTEIDL